MLGLFQNELKSTVNALDLVIRYIAASSEKPSGGNRRTYAVPVVIPLRH